MANTSKREGLLEAIQTENAKGLNRVKCTVLKVLTGLSDEDQADLLTAIANDKIRATTIAKVLTDRGHVITEFSVRRHRQKRCSCGSIRG